MFQSPDVVPKLRNCHDLQRAGFDDNTDYWVDPSGEMNLEKSKEVMCFDGWTRILRRAQYGQKHNFHEADTWAYRSGIGTATHESEQLLGLEYIHR